MNYEFMLHHVSADTKKHYFEDYYRANFEDTLRRQINKNQYKYSELMADEMRTLGSTWVEKEGREYDLDIDDAQMDHIP